MKIDTKGLALHASTAVHRAVTSVYSMNEKRGMGMK